MLPGYLDHLQLVTRAGGKPVLSDHDRWAESLGTAISWITASNPSRPTESMNI